MSADGNPAGAATPGSISGDHGRVQLPIYVAPTSADGFNTVRQQLLPIACFRLEDLRFDFDSSFIAPEAKSELPRFASLWSGLGEPPISIFGHADPTGDDAYNKKLSGRRALAVHALLLRDVDGWEALFHPGFGGDKWGLRSLQRMLGALGFDPGEPDGKMGPRTKRAVQGFQTDNGLAPDGDPGKLTRAALFPAYMDFICQDETGAPFVLTAENFLARGANAKGRGDLQGCGELNPVLVFSKDEESAFEDSGSKKERDATNLPNRRVLIFLFPKGSEVDPSKWPCPAAADGPEGCKASLWSNGDERRALSDERRLYVQTHDTMACRFYDRMARGSPCEVTRTTLLLRLLDEENEFIPNAPYRLDAGGDLREGIADETGHLVEQNIAMPERLTVEYGFPSDFDITPDERSRRWGSAGPFQYSIEVTLADEPDDLARVEAILGNLGYSDARTLEENLISFQRDFELFPADGVLDDRTKDALFEIDRDALSREEFVKRHKGDATS